MSKSKAIVVTAILTAMTVTILLCLLALKYKVAFFLISAVFAFVGLAHAALAFFDWITDDKEEPEEDLDVPSVVADPEDWCRNCANMSPLTQKECHNCVKPIDMPNVKPRKYVPADTPPEVASAVDEIMAEVKG